MHQNRRMNHVAAVTVALCCLLPTLLVQAQPQHPAQQQQQRFSRSETDLHGALAPGSQTATAGEHISGRRFKRMYAMCPPHFFRIGNECYYISANKQNWLDAHFECKDRNSKLAEPMKYDDKNLRKFLISSKAKNYIWIGGNYNWRANKWQWGYNGKDIGYQSFSQMVPGSSQDLKYHCAVLNPDLRFRWSAKLCTEKLNFICQHKMPFVNSHSRTKVYTRWNATFPNELANEVEVVVADQPVNSRKNDYYSTVGNTTTVAPMVLYNRIRGMKQSNRTLRIRPSRRRPTNRKLQPKNDYISNDVYRRPVVEYVQDHNNNIYHNGNGNGYRNGFKPTGFNVDIHRQRPSGHKKQHNNAEQRPHQHRHHLGEARPATAAAPPATTTLPATTTTTTTTTTRAPDTLPTEAFQVAATERAEYGQLSHDEKKARRARLRERLGRLTDEEREAFYAERAKRKRTKKTRTQNETIP
uniref:Putative c-type lectin-like domain protein n=2 Tax=Culex tarsalis TaxID=7177 RepID=A0A1Q3FL98_CULTA